MGQQALETGARRVGQFAEQEASGTREVGNLQGKLDDDIGKQLTSFLRFKGLEDETSGVSVKTKGGGSRSLLGTGTNSGITKNASDRAKAAANTDTQLDKDKIATGKQLQAAQDKLASDKAAEDLTVARKQEDENIKARRADEKAVVQQTRDLNDSSPPTDDKGNPLTNNSPVLDADGNPVKDANGKVVTNALDKYNSDLKAQRALEDSNTKGKQADEDAALIQARAAQDAKIKQAADIQDINKIALAYNDKRELLSGATTLSKLAAQAVTATSPVKTIQQGMDDASVIRGGRLPPNSTLRGAAQQDALAQTGETARQQGVFNPDGTAKEIPTTAETTDQSPTGAIPEFNGIPADATEANSIPTWTGDTPYVPGQEFVSQPGGYAQEVPNTPGIWSSVDKPDAPSLYGDMGNGM